MSFQPELSRRSLLRASAAMCLGLLAKDVLAGGATTLNRIKGGPVRKGQILTREQMQLLRELIEVIIPATDTLGAAGTDTHGFIDDQLAHCRDPQESQLFISRLDEVAKIIKSHWGKEYGALTGEQRIVTMTALSKGQSPFSSHYIDWFYQLKAITVMGYYLSEVGASQELVYDPVPGGYRSDFKVSDNHGKAFSAAFYSN
ncbi:gluconate 2-dehydrogenase subunit 3 family protein [Neptunicella sp. SCSIO 80796]|uniref:gluconate 2-dehydrogenase subunit 3 family protein n=1 Tax=Neptunicella plasticusilytica TaxID=3117012 RepID=UPI003A4DD0F8